MKLLTSCDKYLAGLLMVSFFLPLKIQLIAVLSILGFMVLRDVFDDPKHGLKNGRFALLLASIYLLYPLFLLFTPKDHYRDVFIMMERQSSLFALPFVFLLLKKETLQVIYRQRMWFVIACFVFCLAGNLLYFLEVDGSQPVSHVQYRVLFEAFTGIHPTYMGMFICFSIALLMTDKNWNKNFSPWIIASAYFIFLVFLFALFPKSPVIAVFLILFHFLFMNRSDKAVIFPLAGGIVAAVLTAFFFLSTSMQRVDELSALLNKNDMQTVVDNSVNMRKVIWQIDMDLLKQHWLWGIGPGKLNAAVFQHYFDWSLLLGMQLGYYDLHNQYIFFWLSFGLLGFLLFLSILLFQWKAAIAGKNHLYGYLLIILMVTFLTENVLSRQHGVIFYGFFTSLLFFTRNKKWDKLELSDRHPIGQPIQA